MKVFYYFNGWNSAIPDNPSENLKCQAIKKYCKKNGYEFRPTTIDFKKPSWHVRQILHDVRQVATVVYSGTSLGGWFARIMQLRTLIENPKCHCYALAFNPSVDTANSMRKHYGWHTNYVTNIESAWTFIDCDELQELQDSVQFDSLSPLWVFCDQDDDIVSWQDSLAYYGKFCAFLAFPGGNHRFQHIAQALEAFNDTYKCFYVGSTK